MTSDELTRLARTRRAVRDGTARRVRENAGVSQSELAAALGVSRSAVSLWELGARAPRGPVAHRYAALLSALAPEPAFNDNDERPASRPGAVTSSGGHARHDSA